MTLDDRLGDLLTEAADHALPPTEAGVRAAIDRRHRRRQRQRLAVSGLALACVLGGIGAAVVVAQRDTTAPSVVDGPVDRPLVGVDLPGWELQLAGDSSQVGDGTDDIVEIDRPFAMFAEAEDPLAGPTILLAVGLSDVDLDPSGDPVDLDGDGRTDGSQGRDETGATWVSFTVPGTAELAGVSSISATEDAVVAYAATLATGPPFTLDDAPAPDGLPRRFVDRPTDAGVAIATYRDPRRASLVVSTTSDPTDALVFATAVRDDVQPVELGDSFLGPGEAVVHAEGTGVVLTDSGLTVHLMGDGLDVDTVRRIIEEGRFVEVPSSEPAPTTTTVAFTTSTVDNGQTGSAILDVRRDELPDRDRIVVRFDEALPAEYRLEPTDQPFGGDCGEAPVDGVGFYRLRLVDGFDSGLGGTEWPVGGYYLADSPIQVWTCGWYEGEVFLAIAVQRDGDVRMTAEEDDGPPRLVIDFPVQPPRQ